MFTKDRVDAARPNPEVSEKPTLFMTGGRPAAGKTSALKAGGIDFGKAMYISADEIQEKLPGYNGKTAGLFNPEAQDIAAQAEGIGRKLGINMVYDATMKTSSSALERVDEYKKAGYNVEGYFIHTTPATSALRSVERYQRTGRFVPPEVSFNSRTNELTFDRLRPKLDRWALFDNNGAKPRLVSRGGFGA
jgi:predicted ABC-type ATPase